MAVFPGTEPIVEVVQRWKETCLLGDGSMLSPGRRLWTLDQLAELEGDFVKNPLVGRERFLDKLHQQIGGSSPWAIQTAAEMLWVLMIFPHTYSYENKLNRIRTIWEWSGDTLPDSPSWRPRSGEGSHTRDRDS